MAAVIPEEGLMNLLSIAFGAGWDFEVRLFKNDLTPDSGTVLANFVQANYSGYAPIPLDDLPDPVMSPGGKALIQMGDVSFLHNGGATPNNVYGYYIVAKQGVEEKLCWGERIDDAPAVMASADDEIPLSIVITDTQEV